MSEQLRRIYQWRFSGRDEYRGAVWSVLCQSFFQKYVRPEDVVLDLGCGYGEFINRIRCGAKYGIDLNPDVAGRLDGAVMLLRQDAAQPWGVGERRLDVVFTSNYLEHCVSKEALSRTLKQAWRSLKPGGLFIAMGPNIKFVPGAYWDFFDHHIPLTEVSLCEALVAEGFEVLRCEARFLPYSMSGSLRYPAALVALYLALPWAWRVFGKQFLIVARRPL